MRAFFFLAVLVSLSGCRAEDLALMELKLDAPLRQKMETLRAENRTETLGVLGKCSRPVDEQMRNDLKKAGAEIQSVTGELFAAWVRSDHVLRVARLEFVAHLELSQTAEPLGH